MTSSPSASPGAASLDEGGAVGGEIKAQSSSKRQPDANTTVKAVKCNVRVGGSSPALWLLLPIDRALGTPDSGRLWRSGSRVAGREAGQRKPHGSIIDGGLPTVSVHAAYKIKNGGKKKEPLLWSSTA